MVLGVYWYSGFPTGLYHFEYFQFRPGLGGHADTPAELTVTVRTTAPAALLTGLQTLAGAYPETNLFLYQDADIVRVMLGGYQLFDYDFHLAGEVEKLLRQLGVPSVPDHAFPPGSFRRLTPELPPVALPPRQVLQLVGSAPGLYHAETRRLRLDCCLPAAQQLAFGRRLNELCQQADLDVLYYLDHELDAKVNMLVFFTNGRQGLNGRALRHTDARALAAAIEQALGAHGGQLGHLGRFPEHYPRRGPHVVRAADADFVL